jgi:DNA-binding protein YbaB
MPLVTVVCNGVHVDSIHIDRELLAAKTYDLTTLERLIAEAVNEAIREASE